MARRRAARRAHGGGDLVPPRGANRARLAASAGALALTALVGVYAGLGAARRPEVAAALAGVSALALAAGLWGRRPTWVVLGVLLDGAAYAASLVGRDHAVDAGAVAVGSLLFLAAELALLALELALPVRPETGVLVRRAGLVAGLGLGAVLATALVAVAAAREAEPSLLVEGAGVAAAVAALAVVAALGRRARQA